MDDSVIVGAPFEEGDGDRVAEDVKSKRHWSLGIVRKRTIMREIVEKAKRLMEKNIYYICCYYF